MDWIFVIVRAIPLYTTFYIVSIHLMLLFIGSILVKIAEDAEFQYTSCYSLSSSASCFSFLLPGFNTSHVTLYLRVNSFLYAELDVSIHLMLLFIYCRTHESKRRCIVSIHLMLLFIGARGRGNALAH